MGYKPRREKHDYSSDGEYFVTICSNNFDNIFGEIKCGSFIPTRVGRIILDQIDETNMLRKPYGIAIEKFVLMPNHLHLYITIAKARRAVPIEEKQDWEKYEGYGNPTKESVPTVVRSLKSAVTKRLREISGENLLKVWEKSYDCKIIKEKRFGKIIEEYMKNNIEKWEEDCYYNEGIKEINANRKII